MKKTILLVFLLGLALSGFSQTNRVMDIFPEGTKLHGNIPYNGDTLKKASIGYLFTTKCYWQSSSGDLGAWRRLAQQ